MELILVDRVIKLINPASFLKMAFISYWTVSNQTSTYTIKLTVGLTCKAALKQSSAFSYSPDKLNSTPSPI